MKKSLLLLAIICCVTFNVFAQPPVDVYQVVAPSNPMNCTNTTLTITGWNDAGNYSLQSISHFYGNDTIWIDIKYTSPQIVIGVLTPWTHYVSLGNVPYGNWVVVARGYLGGVWQSEANSWLPVDACCPSSIPQFDFVEDTVCAGSSISVTNNSIGNNLSYFWEYEGGTSTAATPTFSISEGGEYDVTLTVTGDSCTDSLVKTIEVLDLPLVELGNDTAICDGDSLELSLPAGNDYLWSDGSISYQNIFGTVGSLAVTVTNDDGCSKSDTIEVTAVLPNVPVNLGPDKTVCPDESVILNAGTGGTSYAWSTGETTQSISVNQEGSVFVTVSESGSCDGVDEIVINWHTLDEAEIMLSADSCQERLIWLDPSTHQVIQWSDASSDTAMLVTTPGYYFVTAEDNNGCESSDSAWVNIVDNPVFSLGNDTFLCGNQTITLTTGISGDHLWKDGSTGIGFTVTQRGTYYVFVTDQNGCTGSDTIRVNDCLGVSEMTAKEIQFYPNPTQDVIHIVGYPNAPYQLMDQTGRIVGVGNLQHDEINVSDLETGIYFIQLIGNNSQFLSFYKI
jgi:PKD repeat protein